MCLGKVLAERAIYAFIASLLSGYDLVLDERPCLFSKGDRTKLSPGIVLLAKGEDVALHPRRHGT
ncbi:hypothetical protein CC78DRAFT_533208 [Lojkania enalia]|uniref:Cytochrome P450 n=1 Tax=Lojkania enalia TaxID=147567 RepID=A0A9P4K922_9PLEO|nr:hypothetical protein CC78DRAFT_533208 [Didymosphaeria enalia]